MDFKMDEQSYRDLNIFGNSENAFSLFDLFKKTKTVGGRALIEYWMRNPTNVIDDLQKRTQAIAFLQKYNLELIIDHDQFDLILHYLNYDRGYLRANMLDAFLPWLRNRIKSNQNYYVVQIGVRNLLSLIKHAIELSDNLIETDIPPLLMEWIDKLKSIFKTPGLQATTSLSLKANIGFYQLSKLDVLFRRNCRLILYDLLNLFYELDALQTLAKAVDTHKFCIPSYNTDEVINLQIEHLFHPALTNPIKNDINIDDEQHLIFLSGSNMAGKSSLLKAIGIAVYLAHIGFPIPAKRLQTNIFNGLITTINLADTIENGLSHYYSEVMRVKKVASLLVEQKKMFIILDELFKGTNAKDAFDASLLVINGFSAIPNSIFIISSHITDLSSQLGSKTIAFKYMEHLTIGNEPKFTYRLKEGVAKDGIGMYFIEKEGILDLLASAKKSKNS